MADFPALPLWTDAYLADTRHLSTEQHGAYLLLLMEAWRRPSCSLPDNDSLLARLSGLSPEKWAENRDVVMGFWEVDGRSKEWKQKRLVRERDFVSKQRASQKGRIAKRWEAKKNAPTGAIPERYPIDTPTPTPTPTIETPSGVLPETDVSGAVPKVSRAKRKHYPDQFEQAWKAYPTSANMSKAEAFKAWEKLDAEDKAAVSRSIPGFLAHCKANPDYHPVYLERFIRQRRFDGYAASTANEGAQVNWPNRLAYARERRVWSRQAWGPMPGEVGCAAPPNLLRESDGVGWMERAAA